MAWPHDPIARYAKAFRPLPHAPAPLPLDLLPRDCCKWPVGEAPWVFCGLPAPDGRYCEVHTEKSGIRLEPLA